MAEGTVSWTFKYRVGETTVRPYIGAYGFLYCPTCKVLVCKTLRFCPHCGQEMIQIENSTND